MRNFILPPLLLILGMFYACQPQTQQLQSDVLVAGGGASGITAALQAARNGATVILVEETPWLGGMLSAAGVSAIDGNHELPSGLWGEFRQKLYGHYGGPAEVSTGWVSLTLFEPSVANRIWNELADAETRLQRFHGYHVVSVEKSDKQVTGATFVNEAGDSLRVKAAITIDATELGDVLALAGAAYRTGQDTEAQPHEPNIQDLTYVAILQDYGMNSDHTIPKPDNYDPSEYECICKQVCKDTTRNPPDCYAMLTYGRLPNGKFMLNWPNNGNDYYLNPLEMSHEERQEAWKAAKDRTLGLVYFLQTEAGFPHLGLAKNEFPTRDHLALIPYHRESRRVEGLLTLKVEDLMNPYADPDRPLYRQAIAVGDYPLDHHHGKNPKAGTEAFPPIPSYSVPYGCLVPKEVDGLLVAEKSISVTHTVNGATRLQPVVMELGQAAGAAAFQCVNKGVQPREVEVQALQQTLLDAGCYLMPYLDVPVQHPFFQAVQRVGVAGLMRGKGVPFQWANQTWFYPDSAVTKDLVLSAVPGAVNGPARQALFQGELSRVQAVQLLYYVLQEQGYDFGEVEALEAPSDVAPDSAIAAFAAQGWLKGWIEGERFEPQRPMRRDELAFLIDRIYLQ